MTPVCVRLSAAQIAFSIICGNCFLSVITILLGGIMYNWVYRVLVTGRNSPDHLFYSYISVILVDESVFLIR